MEPDFIIVHRPDPVAILLQRFPELEDLREDTDLGSYYVYNRFADCLRSLPHDELLWRRAYEFFEELAKSEGDLLQEVFENLCEDSEFAVQLKANVGAGAASFL